MDASSREGHWRSLSLDLPSLRLSRLSFLVDDTPSESGTDGEWIWASLAAGSQLSPQTPIHEPGPEPGSASACEVEAAHNTEAFADAVHRPVPIPSTPIAPPGKGPPQGPPGPPPGPGRKAWLALLGSFCAMFASFGWRSGSGLFQDYYQLNQLRDEPPSTIAWINSIGFFLMYSGAIFVTELNAKFGIKPVMIAGSCLHVGGLVAASFSGSFYQLFLAQGICSSLGASALFFTSVMSMGRWFPRKQALTVGVSTSGTSAGGVVFPLMIERLLVSVGFSWTMRAAAGLIAIMCAVACVTIEAPPPGYGGRPPAPKIKGVRARLAPFKQRRFVLTVLGLALFANGYFVVLIFVVTVARTRGWQNPIEALIVLNGTSFFGRIGPGLAAEYFGRFNTFIALGCLSTGLIFGLWIPGNNVPSAIAFSACFGFTSGCAVSLGPTLVFQISELRMMVWNMALLYVLQSSAALVSSPLGGALLGAGPTPLYLQVFTGSLLAAGTIFFILARVDQSGFALWKII